MHPGCTATTAAAAAAPAGPLGVSGVVQVGGRQTTNRRRTKDKKPTIRRSCDFCNGRKKKCDGDGVNRCSYCINKKNPHCIYSPRRPQKPRARKAPAAPTPTTAAGTTIATTSTGGGGGGAGRGGGLLVEARGRPSLKRGRLGMSLATGLVGTQENAFLGDFFGCMGFLPLTCQSTVREAMVRLLFSNDNNNNKGFSSSVHTWSHPGTPAAVMAMDEEAAYYGGVGGDMSIVSTSRPVSSMMQWQQQQQQQQSSPSDPSTSMFWCAVALGALTQGRPVHSVAPYIRLAKTALLGNEEGSFTDAARAWTLMAYLYGFCGDSENFSSCTEQAERCFHNARTEGQDTSEEEELRVLIEHADGLGIFYGDGVVTGDHIVSYLGTSGPHPQAADATTANHLCQFVMESYHRFGQAFFTDVTGKGDEASTTKERAAVASIEPAGLPDAVPSPGGVLHGPSRSDELSELLCGGDDDDDVGDVLMHIVHDFCANMGDTSSDAISAATVAGNGISAASRRDYDGTSWEERVHQRGVFVLVGNEAMAPPAHTSRNMQEVMMAAVPQYERLEGAVDRPEVRGGIGGLMLNCTSVVLKAAQGNKQACLERARLCVQVLVRYPGIMRFPMGLHISHLLITMIATFEDRQLYTTLMVAYNPIRPAGYLPIPPFEEWEGVSNLCSHVYCRAIDTRFGKRSPPPPQPQPQEQQPQPQPPQPPPPPHQIQHQQPQQATLGHGHSHNGRKVHPGGMPSTPAAAAAAAAAAYAVGVGEGRFHCNKSGGGEQISSFTAGRGGGEGVSGSGFKEEPLAHAAYGSDRRYSQQAATAAAAWRRSPAPSTAVTASPCSADDAASATTLSDDLDGATLCPDIDPIVTPSMLGMRNHHQATASLLPAQMMVPTSGGGSVIGGAPVAETQSPTATVSPPKSSSYGAVFPNAGGPWNAGSSRPPVSSSSSSSSRGGFVGLGVGGGGSIDALEAVLNGDDDDDDDDDGGGGGGGSNFVQLDVLADFPEVKSTYLLAEGLEEPYDGKGGRNNHNHGGGGNHRGQAEAAYRETEEALGKGSFMESTHAMMLGQGFRTQGDGGGGGGSDAKPGRFESSGNGHDG